MPENIPEMLNDVLTNHDTQKQFLNALGELVKENEEFKLQILRALDEPAGEGAKSEGRLSALFPNLNTVVVVQVIVSALLIAVFGALMFLTIALIQTQPKSIMMDDGRMEMFDPFVRASDLLTLIIPIFATVVSFWLGFSIQERKVNKADQMADEQREMREKADKMMAKVEGLTMMMQDNDETRLVRDQIHQIMQSE